MTINFGKKNESKLKVLKSEDGLFPCLEVISGQGEDSKTNYLVWFNDINFQVCGDREGYFDKGHGRYRQMNLVRRIKRDIINDYPEIMMEFYKGAVLEALVHHNSLGYKIEEILSNWNSQETQKIVEEFIEETLEFLKIQKIY